MHPMRKSILAALLALQALSFLGCGESAPPPPTDAERAKLPGTPSEGPEAPKVSKAKKH